MKPENECALLSQYALSCDWISDEDNNCWKDFDAIVPDDKEKEILAKYHSGDPKYQPTISQNEVLSQLGITL